MNAHRNSFTVFELLVAIVLIGIVYGIYIQNTFPKKEREVPGFLSIKEILSKTEFEEFASLVCTEKCRKCYILADGKTVSEKNSPFPEKADVKIYRLLPSGEISEFKMDPFGKEEVCFRYTIRKNGSGSEILLSVGGKYYFFPAYEENPTPVSSYEEGERMLKKESLIPVGSGEIAF